MGDVDKLTPENALLFLQFVVPGFLAIYFRALFVTRRESSVKDNLLLYVLVSTIYAFVTVPLWLWLNTATFHPFVRWLIWFLTLVGAPVVIGVALGVGVQRRWLTSALARLGLHPLSPYPTGWDWIFGQRKSFFVIVTLDDGSQVAGWFGYQSLAASDLSQRDLFIEEIYDLDEHGNWNKRANPQGILVSGKSIKHVEFIPPTQE